MSPSACSGAAGSGRRFIARNDCSIGREHGYLGLLEYTEPKHVHVGMDPRRATKKWFNMTVPQR